NGVGARCLERNRRGQECSGEIVGNGTEDRTLFYPAEMIGNQVDDRVADPLDVFARPLMHQAVFANAGTSTVTMTLSCITSPCWLRSRPMSSCSSDTRSGMTTLVSLKSSHDPQNENAAT